MICGTSTGGLIALALRKGVPVSELRDFYKQMGKGAFKKKFMGNVTMITKGLINIIGLQFKIMSFVIFCYETNTFHFFDFLN
jgi:patatin-like phospholipase/acyl hydrolase